MCNIAPSGDKCKEPDFKPRERFIASAAAGIELEFMGLGPIHASKKVLERAGLTLNDVDLIELNEAFAAQSSTYIDELGFDTAKVNVTGGAIALGYPLGMSGARILTTLLYEMEKLNSRYGLAAVCIGVEQRIVSIWERV